VISGLNSKVKNLILLGTMFSTRNKKCLGNGAIDISLKYTF
jgi:hypothetical protein